MIGSRGAAILRASKLLVSNTGSFKQAVRNGGHHHHWNYRTVNTNHSRGTLMAAEGIMAFMWWWILWHLWTEPGHIFGEFEYPEASQWTDEELGIPSD